MKRLQPALNIEGFDVLRRFIAPAGDEVVANDVFYDDGGVFRLGADGILPEVGLQVMLGKGVEPDAAGSVVDASSPSLSTSRRASRSLGRSRTRPTGMVFSTRLPSALSTRYLSTQVSPALRGTFLSDPR